MRRKTDEANNTGLQTKRVGRGEKVRFTYNMPTATDQEIIVYAGHYLKSLGDVSNLQPTSMLIANADRLTEIECHSPNLINTDLSECTKLQRIDLSDCTALGTGIGAQPILNIQNCKYLRYCDCRNTQLTAIYTMQAGGNLEEIYYPKSTQVVQLTNQTYLHTVGLPSTNPCENLADVMITNCNAIKTLSSETTVLDFNTLKYVQNLNITNSLNGLNSMRFNGFDKLRNVTLSSLKELDSIGFEDMMPITTTSTLKTITISDCPLITSLSFNVSSDDYKVAFASGGKLDLGGLQSLKSIECNTSVKGLDTLIVPTSLTDLRFTTEYGDGINEIKNIWSASAVHNNDGFEGIDFQDMTIEFIDMLGLSSMSNAINFPIAPKTQNPNLNTARDGSESKPWFHPIGSIDLSNYTGSMIGMLRGIDLNKLDVVINTNRDQVDLTSLFECATLSTAQNIVIKTNNILAKFPKSVIWDYMFKGCDLSFNPKDITIPNRRLSLKGMYKDSNITEDLDLPTKLIAVDEMFMNCTSITTTHENWNKTYPSGFTSTNCYKGLPDEIVDEIPLTWGGNGFEKDYTTIFELNLPDDNMTITVNNRPDIKGSCNTNWGDGSPVNKEKSHTYTTAGRYIVKFRNGYMGNEAYQWGNYMNYVSRYINVPKYQFTNVGKPYLVTSITLYSHNSLEYIDWSVFRCKDNLTDTITFANMKSPYITEIDLSELDLSNIKTLNSSFAGCKNIISIKGLNTITNKCTNISQMCSNCTSLEEIIGMDTWGISNCESFSETFFGCSSLTDEVFNTISNWQFGVSFDLYGTFRGTNITNLDFATNWDMSKCTSLEMVCYDCSKLVNADGLTKHTMNLVKLSRCFENCTSLDHLDFTGIKAETWKGVFGRNMPNCKYIVGLDMSGSSGSYEYAGLGGDWTIGCGGMSSLTSIKNWDFSFTKDYDGNYLTNDYWIGAAWRMFGGCNSLTDVTFTGTIHIFDELDNYQIFMYCDTSKFTRATWESFVTCCPTVTTTKSLYLGINQANLDVIPDDIKEALVNKGYTLVYG